jgi:hypothetical protein
VNYLEKSDTADFSQDIFVNNLEAYYETVGQTGEFSNPFDDVTSALYKVNPFFLIF